MKARAISLAALLFLFAGLAARSAVSADPLEGAPSRFVVVDGIRVHYKSLGEGKVALLYVHGWSCDMHFWRDQVAAFDGKIHQILIDLPGHGESTRPDVDYTPELFARAMDAVLKEARAKKAIIVGHSMGTPVAMRFYRLFRRRTAAIVAVDGTLRAPKMTPEERDKWLAQFQGPDFREVQAKFVDSMFKPGSSPDLREWIKVRMQRTPQYVAVSAMKELIEPARWSEEPIKVPLLVVNAESPNWTPEYEAFVKKIAPRVDYRVMEGVGHFLMVEKPAEFNEILSGWLRKERFLKH